MRTERVCPRRAPVLLAALVTGAAVLTGCGGDGDKPTSPFAAPKGEAKVTADLGFPVVATRNTTRTATNDPDAAAAGIARAIYSGGAAETQARVVALVDRNDWRTALAATSLMATPIGAPILFSDGDQLPTATTDALTALRPVGSDVAGGAQAIRIGNVGRPSGLRTSDVGGADSYELALAIDRFGAAARGRASNRVIVVSGDQPQFAAPAAAWLAKTGDPVAFVTKDAIPPATARQLRTHPGAKLYVLGPDSAVSPAVAKQLRRYGTVRRVGDPDPVKNAIAFARFSDGTFGWDVNEPGHGFTFARAGDPLPAITLAPLSATGLHGPLLLLDSASKLPEPIRQYLLDVQPGYQNDPSRGVYNRGWLAGDVSAIDVAVQSQLDALMEIVPVRGAAGTTTTPATTTGAAPAPKTGTTTTGTSTTGTTSAPTPPPKTETKKTP